MIGVGMFRHYVPAGLLLVVLTLCPLLPVHAANGLYRLFTTPEEREQLDSIRESYRPGTATTDEKEEQSQSIILNGVVLGSSGRNTSWVNGRSVDGGRAVVQGVQVQPSKKDSAVVPITLQGTDLKYELKPGQTLDVLDRRVDESYRQADADSEAKSAKPTGK